MSQPSVRTLLKRIGTLEDRAATVEAQSADFHTRLKATHAANARLLNTLAESCDKLLIRVTAMEDQHKRLAQHVDSLACDFRSEGKFIVKQQHEIMDIHITQLRGAVQEAIRRLATIDMAFTLGTPV